MSSVRNETTDERARLERWLLERSPTAEEISVSAFAPASSGSSNDTRLFTLTRREPGQETETLRLVLRTVRDGRGLFPEYDLALQAGVMRALGPTSLPVPVVRWTEFDPAVTGAPFVIMDHVDGETPSDRPPGFHGQGLFFDATPAQRAALWWRLVEHMVRLHALDWRALDLPRLVGMADDHADSLEQQIAQLERWMEWGEVGRLPVLDRAFEWLRRTSTHTVPLSLLWGDARPGNVLFRGGEVVAMLDWELATVGPAGFDVAYLVWSAEMLADVNDTPWLEGLPTRDETFAEYLRLAGRPIDFDYAEVFTLARLTVMAFLGARQVEVDQYFERFVRDSVTMRRLEELVP